MVRRRLAAIMALDMVGYSRLVGLDETGTIERQKACRRELIEPAIERHGGRVVQTAGDGLLAEFASAVAAVVCAADIQRAVAEREAATPDDRRLSFRIGVNLGDIVEDGSDVLGDGVNIAARLEALAEPGGIAISGAVHTEVRDRLDLALADAGERTVKNIRHPVRVWRWKPEAAAAGGATGTPSRAFDRPAIAVLPFDNLSGDPDQEYFADGLAEDLITAFSCMHNLPVIARNSSFSYKGQNVRIHEAARELGARYLLEGSVRKAGGRVRVTVQLIDGETGHHIWAKKYDRSLDDIFQIQDDITLRVASAVEVEVSEAELRRQGAKRPESLTAWDLYLRGMAHLQHRRCDAFKRARDEFEAAIALEPDYGEAWAGLGWSHLKDHDLKCTDDPAASLAAGYEAARKAVALDEASPVAHYVLSTAHVWREELPQSFRALERLLELNPYFAHAHLALGNRRDLAGESEEGIAGMRRALELNPRDPSRGQYMLFLARALTVRGEHGEAVGWVEAAAQLDPGNPDVHYRHAVCLANLDRVEEARAALARCAELRPDFIEKRRSWRPYNDETRNERFFAGMRRHGLMP